MEESEKKDGKRPIVDLQWICPNPKCGVNNDLRRPICRSCRTEKPK